MLLAGLKYVWTVPLIFVLMSFADGANLTSATQPPIPAAFSDCADWSVAPVSRAGLVVATQLCGLNGGGTECECYGDDAQSGNCSPTNCIGCTEGRTCGAKSCTQEPPCSGCPVNGYTDYMRCMCKFWGGDGDD